MSSVGFALMALSSRTLLMFCDRKSSEKQAVCGTQTLPEEFN
jgi:hypothetical protein